MAITRARAPALLAAAVLTGAFCSAGAPCAYAQDLLNDVIDLSSFKLNLRPYITLPSNRNDIISMTTRPGDARLYVTTQEGYVFAINEDANGATTTTQFFNVVGAIQASGHTMNGSSGQQGLQSIAFHPDFNKAGQPGYGKLYTTYLENRPASAAGHSYLGNSVRGATVNADGVLIEWTYDHGTGQVPSSSYRELFRVNMPKYDHPIKQARFNPLAVPGDDDYGLLYLTHGDSNEKHSPNDEPTRLDNALGKMIRINPLPSGSSPYTIPSTNPFADSSDPAVLKEIYAYGFRNPHTYSFNRDDAGGVHILVGDIGRNNVEEVDVVVPGGNYGWTKREGTFVHLQLPDSDPNAGYLTDLAPLPAHEASLGYIYPAAQYDHDSNVSEVSSGNSIASGFVIRNGSDPNLHNQFLFSDFSRRDIGDSFHADFDELLAAVTQLDENDPNRDEPGDLTQAPIHEIRLSLDHDNNPATAPQLYDDFLQLLNNTRTDVRYGEGAFGEMYISSKVNGTIYLVTNSVAVKGDFDADGAVTGADFLLWQRDLGQAGTESPADANRDDVVDEADLAIWRANFGRTYGDATPSAAKVPEPRSVVMLMSAGLVLRLRRGRDWRLRRSGSAG